MQLTYVVTRSYRGIVSAQPFVLLQTFPNSVPGGIYCYYFHQNSQKDQVVKQAELAEDRKEYYFPDFVATLQPTEISPFSLMLFAPLDSVLPPQIHPISLIQKRCELDFLKTKSEKSITLEGTIKYFRCTREKLMSFIHHALEFRFLDFYIHTRMGKSTAGAIIRTITD